MSPAACAGSPPGPRSESRGTAGLLYAVYAAGTAWAGVRAGRVRGLGAADLETVLSGVLLKDADWGACGAVAQPSLGVLATAVHQRPRRTDRRTMHA